ncbi:F-box protein-like protein [Tanacetum coccineum]
MRTRSGSSYSYLVAGAPSTMSRKKQKLTSAGRNYFDVLHDDIVLSILVKVSSTAECPADFISALATYKRNVCRTAKQWSHFTNRFLPATSRAGNIEASYILGMIQFYCFQNWGQGASLMARAAVKSHAPALYSLAIIQFNGSGGTKNKKDLIAGVTLCARAAVLGHIDAVRELGHCLKDATVLLTNTVAGQRS